MLQDGNQNAKQQWVQQNAYNKKGNLRKVERERERESSFVPLFSSQDLKC